MVILFVAENVVDYELWCWSRAGDEYSLTSVNETPITPLGKGACSWNSRIGTCSVLAGMSEFAVTDSITSNRIKVAYREPIKEKYDVVACYAPIFYNEKWQTLVPLVEVHRQYGFNMQVFYVESALSAIIQFLSIYVARKLAHLEPWYGSPVNVKAPGLTYDPNQKIAFRNQIGGQTDCLLLFKQSAEFIMFTDVDEILFPRLGRTYLDEFRYLSIQNPMAGSFSYHRFHAVYDAGTNPDELTISSLLRSAIVTSYTPIKCVGIASRIRTNYFHRCTNDPGYTRVNVTVAQNFMLHLRYDRSRTPQKIVKKLVKASKQVDFLIPRSKLPTIDKRFRDFLANDSTGALHRLPQQMFYYDIFFNCYMWLGSQVRAKKEICATHQLCNIPKIANLNCSVASVPYSYDTLPNLTVHYRLGHGHLRTNTHGC